MDIMKNKKHLGNQLSPKKNQQPAMANPLKGRFFLDRITRTIATTARGNWINGMQQALLILYNIIRNSSNFCFTF